MLQWQRTECATRGAGVRKAASAMETKQRFRSQRLSTVWPTKSWSLLLVVRATRWCQHEKVRFSLGGLVLWGSWVTAAGAIVSGPAGSPSSTTAPCDKSHAEVGILLRLQPRANCIVGDAVRLVSWAMVHSLAAVTVHSDGACR